MLFEQLGYCKVKLAIFKSCWLFQVLRLATSITVSDSFHSAVQDRNKRFFKIFIKPKNIILLNELQAASSNCSQKRKQCELSTGHVYHLRREIAGKSSPTRA